MENWLLELDKSGFCYQALKSIEGKCADYLAKDNISDIDRITVYIIRSVCFLVASYLDDGPVEAQTHNQIESILLGPLKEAISLITSSDHERKLATASHLIVASQKARRIPLHSS